MSRTFLFDLMLRKTKLPKKREKFESQVQQQKVSYVKLEYGESEQKTFLKLGIMDSLYTKRKYFCLRAGFNEGFRKIMKLKDNRID